MEIPRLKSRRLMGSIKEFQKEPFQFPAKVASKYGGIAKFRVFHRNIICINHPDLFHHVMVKNHAAYERGLHYKNQHVLFGRGMISTEGEEWHKKRLRGAPAFHQEQIQRMVPLSVNAANKFLEEWNDATGRDPVISLVPAMHQITISVICQSLFSVDLDKEKSIEFGQIIQRSMGLIRKKNNSLLRLPVWMPTRGNSELLRTKGAITRFVLEKTAARTKKKESGTETNDILEILLRSHSYSKEELPNKLPQDILDECKTLLVAGFETTAFTLTWALYLLATHPDVAEKWHQECDRILEDPHTLTWNDLEKLEYTRQIILETMRLYPVVYSLPRECVQDDLITGYKINKGDFVLLSIYGMHRAPEYWPNPDAFDPGRFANGKDWPRKSYAPFGKGKHTCLGNHFALTEMLIILALIGRRFSIKMADHSNIGIKCTFVMMPDRDIRLEVNQR